MASQGWISNSTSTEDRKNSSLGSEAQASSSPPRKRQRQNRRASASSSDSQLPSSSDCKTDSPTLPTNRAHLQSQEQAQDRLPSLRPLPIEILPVRLPFAAPTPRLQLPPLRPSQTRIQEGDRRRALPPVEPLQLPPLRPAGSPTDLGVRNPENQHEQVGSPPQTALSLPSLRPAPEESEFQHSFQLSPDAVNHHPFSNTRVKDENDSDEFEEEYISRNPLPALRPHNRQLPHPLL